MKARKKEYTDRPVLVYQDKNGDYFYTRRKRKGKVIMFFSLEDDAFEFVRKKNFGNNGKGI